MSQFSHSVVSDSATPCTAACQASLSITNSQSLLKLMSIELVMLYNHLILCRPFLLLPSIFPSVIYLLSVYSSYQVFYYSLKFISIHNSHNLYFFYTHCNGLFTIVLVTLLRNQIFSLHQKKLTWNNRLVPNRKRSTSRLYIVTLLI